MVASLTTVISSNKTLTYYANVVSKTNLTFLVMALSYCEEIFLIVNSPYVDLRCRLKCDSLIVSVALDLEKLS